jgi:putative ABC transport system permease protein
MSLFRIAWRSIQQRGVASLLTTLSMALGVTMVVAVLSIYGVVSESFRSNSSLGYNLLVGAKGGKLQLTLNTVYYLSEPIENIPYTYYLEFKPAAERLAEFTATQARIGTPSHPPAAPEPVPADSAESDLAAPGSASASRPAERESTAAATTNPDSTESSTTRIWPAEFVQRDGKYASFTAFAIPLCLGDYYGRFRVVGTVPQLFDLLRYGPTGEENFRFAQGRNFETWNQEHGYFEAVVGASVAREMNVRAGDRISPAHGDPEGEQHGDQFAVVGVLAPSGTPHDRAVFVNIEGFYLMDDHAKPVSEEDWDLISTSNVRTHANTRREHGATEPAFTYVATRQAAADRENPPETHSEKRKPLPVEQREVTAILVRTSSDLYMMSMENSINEGRDAQAVAPVREITILFDQFVSPIQLALLAVTILICIVSGISILVSIYNSMSERKHEIAVMRALGASRNTVMTVILLESILLSLGGGLAGWTGGHALNALASREVEARTGVSVGFFSFAPPIENVDLLGLGPVMAKVPPELLLIPGLMLLAILVGLIPALAAYRTDVGASLGT